MSPSSAQPPQPSTIWQSRSSTTTLRWEWRVQPIAIRAILVLRRDGGPLLPGKTAATVCGQHSVLGHSREKAYFTFSCAGSVKMISGFPRYSRILPVTQTSLSR